MDTRTKTTAVVEISEVLTALIGKIAKHNDLSIQEVAEVLLHEALQSKRARHDSCERTLLDSSIRYVSL